MFGVKAKEFSFTVIEFKSIQRHPSPYISDACLEARDGISTVIFIVRAVACQVELGVVGIEVEVGRVGPDNVTNGGGINAE